MVQAPEDARVVAVPGAVLPPQGAALDCPLVDLGDDEDSGTRQRRQPNEIAEGEQGDSAGQKPGRQQALLPPGQISSELDGLTDLEQRSVRHSVTLAGS